MKRWPCIPLGELVSLEYGKALKAEDRSESGRYPVYGSNGIVGSHDMAVVSEPTIIVGRKGAIGEAHLAENGCWPIDTAFYTKLVKPDVVSLRYLLFWFRSVDLKSLAITATIPGLNRNTLYGQRVPVPSLAEQDRIVKLLNEADELRKLRTEADLRTVALVPSLFHKMFGDPASPGKFKWVVPLNTIGKIVTGNTPPRKHADFYGDFIEWIKTDNIDPTRGVITRAAERLSEQGATRGRVVSAGSVLVTCIAGSRGRIGDSAVTDRPVAINQQINAIIPEIQNDAVFVSEMIRALKSVIQSKATGVMTGIINKSALGSVNGIRPPLSAQREFATQVTQIRALQLEQAASRERLDNLFQSALHRAFQHQR